MLRRILLSAVLTLTTAGLAMAQQTVTGTVTDAESDFPLPGVNIAIQGTFTGTATGLDGTYSIRVNPGDVLVFTFVGYLPQEITVGDQTVIDIALAEDVALLQEVVVVGYGTQRKADVTGAVGSVDVAAANVGLVQSPEQMIQGRVAGVQVIQNDGEPGGGVTVRIRGGTSISASNDPLYVIDGVPIDNSATQAGEDVDLGFGGDINGPRNPLSFLNPSDIESIDILKDASAAAIYGSRGANGVVLITTKKGRAGQLQVDYNGYVSSSGLRKKIPLLSASQYRTFVQNNGFSTSALGDADTDWQDAVTQDALSHSHDLAFSGGTESTRYRASINYLNQEGIIINSGQERIAGRLNADHKSMNDKLRLGVNMTASYVEDNLTPTTETNGFESALLGNVLKFNPTNPVNNADGSYFELASPSIRNPVAIAEQVQQFGETTRILGNTTAEYEIVEGLSAKVNLGLDRLHAINRAYIPKASPLGQASNGLATQQTRERLSKIIEVTGTYSKVLNDDHDVTLLGGYSWQDFSGERFGVVVTDFVTDATSYNNLAGGREVTEQTSNKETSKLISFFGRANYGYQGKYLLTATLRRDGSSRFGANEKWGLFPSASAKWRISQESFMSDLDWIDDLSLRVGWGITGSQEIGNYRSLPTLEANSDFTAVIGEQEVVGIAPNNFATPDLKWEETKQLNVGLDFEFWSSRLAGSVEYYQKNTQDLLLEFTVPQPAAVATRLANVGELQNNGLELSLTAFPVDRGDLTVEVGATFNANSNEIKSLGDASGCTAFDAADYETASSPCRAIFTGNVSGAGLSDINAQVITRGQPFGTFVGPVFTGFDSDGNETFLDADGDGNRDIEIIGNAQPDFTYGFTSNVRYKNWDLSLFLRGSQGNQLLNNTFLEYSAKFLVNTNVNFLETAFEGAPSDCLGSSGCPGAIPGGIAVYSDRWVQDASFLRLENLTLGYTFNNVEALSSAIGVIRKVRVYASAQNLFVLTDYEGWDPEVQSNSESSIGNIPIGSIGIDYINYPRPRTFTLGVGLTF